MGEAMPHLTRVLSLLVGLSIFGLHPDSAHSVQMSVDFELQILSNPIGPSYTLPALDVIADVGSNYVSVPSGILVGTSLHVDLTDPAAAVRFGHDDRNAEFPNRLLAKFEMSSLKTVLSLSERE